MQEEITDNVVKGEDFRTARVFSFGLLERTAISFPGPKVKRGSNGGDKKTNLAIEELEKSRPNNEGLITLLSSFFNRN